MYQISMSTSTTRLSGELWIIRKIKIKFRVLNPQKNCLDRGQKLWVADIGMVNIFRQYFFIINLLSALSLFLGDVNYVCCVIMIAILEFSKGFTLHIVQSLPWWSIASNFMIKFLSHIIDFFFLTLWKHRKTIRYRQHVT